MSDWSVKGIITMKMITMDMMMMMMIMILIILIMGMIFILRLIFNIFIEYRFI